MRQSLPFVFAVSLLMSGAALAGPSEQASAPPRLTAEQIDELEGLYALSNGRRARVTVVNNRLFAEIGKYERHELFFAGPDTLVSRNGRVTLHAPSSGKEASLALRRDTSPNLLSSL